MKALSSVVCIICLLLPAISVADQPCFPCLAKMLDEGSLSEEALQSIVSREWNDEKISTLMAEIEEITPAADLRTVLCTLFAWEFIPGFTYCLFFGIDDMCATAWVYGWAYCFFCIL